ncbi:hypothetical protein H1D32_07770 [Anaerobacillus sp. CMMVII]|uniref:hypothetical protein n=1 Tax=Anaerobacillus sp. CMMVII TaxID=2755588 RepID=UPI0021B78896|nr:hypothetical protein [Anaerobacillus sp. CMMVII]MCT8137660.1 hypothetical protein [Anaerobacillus sp. CMMVII]
MAKYLSANQINVRHQYLPTRNTASKKLPILLKSNRPLIHVFKDKIGNYFLWKGIEVYQTLKVLNSTLKIPCQIHQGPANEYQWTLKLLQSCYLENSYWKVKMELIRNLLNDDKKTAEQISEDSGIELKEIKKYLIQPDVPDDYKELAISNGKHTLVNSICNNKKLTDECKTLLYEAVFHYSTPITFEQYNLFKKYIRDGYQFDPSEAGSMVKLKEIVNQNAALIYYWSSLNSGRYYLYPRLYFKRKNDEITKKTNLLS